MDQEDEGCPICLGDYTSSGDHRIVSLKCGHLFGQHCLKAWFNKKKSALCPKCCKKSRESEIRPIFANKIVAVDSNKEETTAVELYEEKRKVTDLTIENQKLKTTIQFLSSEIQKLEANKPQKLVINWIHKRFIRKIVTKVNKNSIFDFDKMSDLLIFTTRDNVLGIKKIKAPCLQTFEFKSFGEPFESTLIEDMKISPFNDGILGVVFKNRFKLIFSTNFKEVRTFECLSNLSALSFDPSNREIVYLGDKAGNLITFNIELNNIVESRKVMDCPVHSIYKNSNVLLVGGVKGVYEFKDNNFIQINSEIAAVCTAIYSCDPHYLIVYRDCSLITTHYFSESKTNFNFYRKQYHKSKDKVYETYLFVIDDEKNEICVFDLMNEGKIVYSYKVKEVVVDFICTPDFMFVATMSGIYVFVD